MLIFWGNCSIAGTFEDILEQLKIVQSYEEVAKNVISNSIMNNGMVTEEISTILMSGCVTFANEMGDDISYSIGQASQGAIVGLIQTVAQVGMDVNKNTRIASKYIVKSAIEAFDGDKWKRQVFRPAAKGIINGVVMVAAGSSNVAILKELIEAATEGILIAVTESFMKERNKMIIAALNTCLSETRNSISKTAIEVLPIINSFFTAAIKVFEKRNDLLVKSLILTQLKNAQYYGIVRSYEEVAKDVFRNSIMNNGMEIEEISTILMKGCVEVASEKKDNVSDSIYQACQGAIVGSIQSIEQLGLDVKKNTSIACEYIVKSAIEASYDYGWKEQVVRTAAKGIIRGILVSENFGDIDNVTDLIEAAAGGILTAVIESVIKKNDEIKEVLITAAFQGAIVGSIQSIEELGLNVKKNTRIACDYIVKGAIEASSGYGRKELVVRPVVQGIIRGMILETESSDDINNVIDIIETTAKIIFTAVIESVINENDEIKEVIITAALKTCLSETKNIISKTATDDQSTINSIITAAIKIAEKKNVSLLKSLKKINRCNSTNGMFPNQATKKWQPFFNKTLLIYSCLMKEESKLIDDKFTNEYKKYIEENDYLSKKWDCINNTLELNKQNSKYELNKYISLENKMKQLYQNISSNRQDIKIIEERYKKQLLKVPTAILLLSKIKGNIKEHSSLHYYELLKKMSLKYLKKNRLPIFITYGTEINNNKSKVVQLIEQLKTGQIDSFQSKKPLTFTNTEYFFQLQQFRIKPEFGINGMRLSIKPGDISDDFTATVLDKTNYIDIFKNINNLEKTFKIEYIREAKKMLNQIQSYNESKMDEIKRIKDDYQKQLKPFLDDKFKFIKELKQIKNDPDYKNKNIYTLKDDYLRANSLFNYHLLQREKILITEESEFLGKSKNFKEVSKQLVSLAYDKLIDRAKKLNTREVILIKNGRFESREEISVFLKPEPVEYYMPIINMDIVKNKLETIITCRVILLLKVKYSTNQLNECSYFGNSDCQTQLENYLKENVMGLEDTANTYLRNNDYKEAINAAQQALCINEMSIDAMKIIAKSLAKIKKMKEAKKWYLKSLNTQSSNTSSKERLHISLEEFFPEKFKLTVNAIPEDVNVHIYTIWKNYKPGLTLDKGRHKIEVSKPYFKTKTIWIKVEDKPSLTVWRKDNKNWIRINNNSPVTIKLVPCGWTFIDFFQNNDSQKQVKGFSFNLLNQFKYVTGFQLGVLNLLNSMRGIQIGSIANGVKNNMCGIQIGSIGNEVRSNMNGIQIGGIGNEVMDNMSGIQIGILFNKVSDNMQGIQIGVLNKIRGDGYGIQLGLLNYSKNSNYPIMPLLRLSF